MKPVGAPTLLTHHRLSTSSGALRREAETARIELVTGRKANLPLELGHLLGGANLTRAVLDSLEGNRAAADSALLRGKAVQNVLASVSMGASEIAAALEAALGRGDERTVSVESQEAFNRLTAAFSGLNTRINGLSLFAGDAADKPALGDVALLMSDISAIYAGSTDAAQFEASLDAYFDDAGGGFATSIYQGGFARLNALEVAPGRTVIAAAKADDQSVKDILRGFSVIAVAGRSGQTAFRDEALRAAFTKLHDGASGIADLRAAVGIDEQTAQDAKQRLDFEETMLTESYNSLTGVDQFEVASRLQSLETQLESAYVLTSRISRLSLVNFL